MAVARVAEGVASAGLIGVWRAWSLHAPRRADRLISRSRRRVGAGRRRPPARRPSPSRGSPGRAARRRRRLPGRRARPRRSPRPSCRARSTSPCGRRPTQHICSAADPKQRTSRTCGSSRATTSPWAARTAAWYEKPVVTSAWLSSAHVDAVIAAPLARAPAPRAAENVSPRCDVDDGGGADDPVDRRGDADGDHRQAVPEVDGPVEWIDDPLQPPLRVGRSALLADEPGIRRGHRKSRPDQLLALEVGLRDDVGG